MLRKIEYLNQPYSGPAPEGSLALEREGHHVLRGAFSAQEIERLRAEILGVYSDFPPDQRAGRSSPQNASMFRYEMFNRSAL